MGGALAYALRRTSARAVLVAGAAGLVWAMYRALRVVPSPSFMGPRFMKARTWFGPTHLPPESPRDLAAAVLVAVIALAAAAAFWRGRATSG